MWFDVVGYEDRLQVTRCGRVRSKGRFIENYPSGKRYMKERELKGSIDKYGYKRVDIRNSKNKGANLFLHRLIAITFLGDGGSNNVVNHIDGNKLNNHCENLEWCSQSYNNKHAWENGLCENQKKPVISHDGSGFGVWLPSMHGSKCYNPPLIHAACNGRQLTHRGMFWEYFNDAL